MDNEWLGNYLTSMGLPPVPQKKFNGLVPPPDQMGSLSVMGTTGGGAMPAPTNFKPPAPQIADAQPSQQRQGGGGTVDISEDEFRTGTPPMEIDTRSAGTSSDYSWIDTALDGALGKPEPSRYDYGAPQHNAPGGSAKRDYRNDSEIVIEDSTGPNSAGINRTVVKATQRPEFKREQGDYRLGQAFREQPKAVADLVQSIMSGRGRQQPQGPKAAPYQAIEKAAELMQVRATQKAALEKAKGSAGGWFGVGRDSEIQDLEAKAQPEFENIDRQIQLLSGQYPTLFGGGQRARSSPEKVIEQLRVIFPNITQEMAQEIALAYAS